MKRIAVLALTGLSLAACGSSVNAQDHVKKDLTWLLSQKGIKGTVDYCTHDNGNDYTCSVSGTSNGQVLLSVVDDGHSIIEQGAQ